jgi:peptide/nickel transport system substrate-binding protein
MGVRSSRTVGEIRRFLPVLGLVAVVALAACGGSSNSGSSSSPGGKVVEGGTFRVGTVYTINSLNPFVATQTPCFITFQYVYPRLVQLDAKLQYTGDFATSWESSTDGLTWTFHTVPNAKWSDGQPLTAQDAAFTINTTVKYQKGPTAINGNQIAHVTRAEATDPNTLVVHFDKAIATVLSSFAQMSILPEHVWSKYATGDGSALKTFPNTPPMVSGGPFILVNFKMNDIALFKKNPNWYGTAPHMDGWGIRIYSSPDAMVLALKNGDLDFIAPVPPTSVATLKSSGFKIQTFRGIQYHDLIINTNPNQVDHKELADPKVREAFAHAVDRQKIVDVAYEGLAEPGSSIVPPSTGKWFNPNLKPETFDLALANTMLDDLGYTKGPDGIRTAFGQKMQYEVIFPTDEVGAGDRAFQIVQSAFKQIGVVLTQRRIDNSAAYGLLTAPNNKYLDFNLAQWGWITTIDPDFILSCLTTGQLGAFSDSGYSNPEYDRMYSEQSTLLDEKQRQQMVWKMQEIIYNARPYIVTVYNDWVEAWSSKWKGGIIRAPGFEG